MDNKEIYDRYVLEFKKRFDERFTPEVKRYADYFLRKLKGKKILDLGCGTGSHLQYFQERGFDAVGIDFSRGMVNLCKEQGFEVKVMDMNDLSFPDKTFDGICISASLLHISGDRIPNIVDSVKRILKKNGIIYVSVKEGKGDYVENNGYHRHFFLYSDQEVRDFFSDFELLYFSKNKSPKGGMFLNYLLRLK